MTDHVLTIQADTADAHRHLREVVKSLGPRHVLLQIAFFRAVAELLEYADHQLLEGESLDLDELAQLIAAHVRPNLTVVYGSSDARECELAAARAEYVEALDALHRGEPGAYDRALAAAQRLNTARTPAV